MLKSSTPLRISLSHHVLVPLYWFGAHLAGMVVADTIPVGPTIITVLPPWLSWLLLSERLLDLLLEWHTIPHHCLLIALCLALPVWLGLLLCLYTELILVVSVASVC